MKPRLRFTASFILGVVILLQAASYALAAPRRLSGYAWSPNVGWVSFRGTAADGSPYGVFVDDTTGAFSGHAWSSDVGWLSFEKGAFSNITLPGASAVGSPVGNWRFDETGGTQALDSSGNANNGSLIGNPARRTGILGRGIGFDSMDDVVRVDTPTAGHVLNPATSITVEAFINPSAGYGSTANPGIVSKRGSGDEGWGGIWVSTEVATYGKIWGRIYQSNGFGRELPKLVTLPTDKWSHVALVADATVRRIYLYVNGAPAGSFTYDGTLRQSTQPLLIGQQLGGRFKGAIDEVRIYDRPLSQTEILARYNEVTGGTGITGYWRMDETSGVVVGDSSGNDRHGTVNRGFTPAIGKNGGAYSFENTLGQYVTLPEATLTSSANIDNLTIQGWFYWKSGITLMRDFGWGPSDPLGGWALGINIGGRLQFDAGERRFSTGVSVAGLQNAWHHYAMVKSGGTVRYYIDGEQVFTASGVGNTKPVQSPWYVMKNGRHVSGNDAVDYTSGFVDDIRIYNRALAEAEIKAYIGTVNAAVARLNLSAAPNRVEGFGRFLSTDTGWEGLLKFDGTGYGVIREELDLLGYAWGSDKNESTGKPAGVPGWISFSGNATDAAKTPYGISILNVNPGFSISVSADPASGQRPLNDVDFNIEISGNTLNSFVYKVDCTSDGAYDVTQTGTQTTYTVADACDYNIPGRYLATVLAEELSASPIPASVDYKQIRIDVAPRANLSGYGWSSEIGWISFRGRTADDYPYGVYVDENTGNLSGYAWSSNSSGGVTGGIGWINFAPSGPYPGAPNFSARYNFTTDTLEGWARVVSAGDGWDGWIKLGGTATDGTVYRVKRDILTNRMEGFAWGGDVIGWISFCGPGGNPYCVIASGLVRPVTATLTAIPNNGKRPLTGVDLAATVNTTNDVNIFPVTYKFDCTDDVAAGSAGAVYERTITVPAAAYTATDLCRYDNAGSYTASVRIEQGTGQVVTARATTKVIVFPGGIIEVPP